MKKLLLGICIIVSLAFLSCGSSAPAYVFDPGIPRDEMSYLFVPNYVKVTQFDGKDVEWTAPPAATTPVKVGVPSGEYTFVINTIISGSNSTGVPDVTGQSYTKNFETGKGYQLINRSGEITLINLK